MKVITAYLTFRGNCRQAMNFYAKCLGGELQICTFGENSEHVDVNETNRDRVLHSSLVVDGNTVLMASDCMSDHKQSGDERSESEPKVEYSLSIDCESEELERQYFSALSVGGRVAMPLKKQFWGSLFGMIVDQFGVKWMLNYSLPDNSSNSDTTAN